MRKYTIFIFILFITILNGKAQFYSFEAHNIHYMLKGISSDKVEVTYEPYFWNGPSDHTMNRKKVVIPSVVWHKNKRYHVTEIANLAFLNNQSLTSIYVPKTISYIGFIAFKNCPSLKSINVNTKNPHFCSVDGVLFNADKTILIKHPAGRTDTSYIIPPGVKCITMNAFELCSSLRSVVIPEGVTKIATETFLDCSAITSINIPNSVTSIEDWTFCNCQSLSSINIPNNILNIGWGAFHGTALHKDSTNYTNGALYIDSCLIEIPKEISGNYKINTGTRLIAKQAFCNQSTLTSVNIPESVKSIGSGAFAYCTNLYSVSIGHNVTHIGEYAFSMCSSLTSIVIPERLTKINQGMFKGCTSLTSVKIGENVTIIEPNVFDETALYNDESNWINGILYVDNCLIRAKANSGNICKIVEGTRIIADKAFMEHQSLTSLTLPQSLTAIGDMAFMNCQKLAKITIHAPIPPHINEETFKGVNPTTIIYVPAESIADYQEAPGWKNFVYFRPLTSKP